jgi:hypothetical protein
MNVYIRDQPKYTARPKREGYFICAGEVEVAARRGRVKGSKNKPKVRDCYSPDVGYRS